MKKLMLLAAGIIFTTSTLFAQNTGNGSVGIQTNQPAQTMQSSPAMQNSKATKTAAMYYCPKYMYASAKPGLCPKCHVKMVKEGMYYCPKCYTTSAKAGKCPKCGMEMKKMTASASQQNMQK